MVTFPNGAMVSDSVKLYARDRLTSGLTITGTAKCGFSALSRTARLTN
jgi:hypothetical protein